MSAGASQSESHLEHSNSSRNEYFKAGPGLESANSLSEFKLYRPPNVSGNNGTSVPDLPPQYFEPTAYDLRATQATLAARAAALRDAPLLTQKLREEKQKEKLNRFPNATIRIKFADRTQLEKRFLSTDKIKSIYAFVRSCLRDDMKIHKFVLYQTPPHRELKVSDPNVKDKTLLDLQLAPASVLMFKFLDDTIDIANRDSPPPLLPEIIQHYTDLPTIPRAEGEPRTTFDPSSKSVSKEDKTDGSQKKVPKWFKPIKK